MKNVLAKIRSRSGESLAEVLVAMLIILLAALLLMSMVSASGNIDMQVKEQDSSFYDALSRLEKKAGTESKTGKVTVTDDAGTQIAEIDVKVYTQDGMRAYEKDAPAAAPGSGG